MNKAQFLAAIRLNAANVPPEELAALLDYYTEMIDEAIDEGCPEEEAVARLGSWDEIREQIHTFRIEEVTESEPIAMPNPTEHAENSEKTNSAPAAEPRTAKKRNRISLPTWAVVLLILTSPVWGTVVLTLLIVLFAVVFSLVVVGGALVISLFAVVVSLGAVGVVGIPAAFILLATSGIAPFLLTIGMSLFCAGTAILGGFLSIAFARFFMASVRFGYKCIRGCFH